MAVSVLVDTSVWIEYLRDTGSRHALWLRRAIDGGAPLVWTEPILFELASGAATDARAARIAALVARGPVERVHGLIDWADAATLRRKAARAGTPLRSSLDALIAQVAIRTGTPVIARDRDFRHLAAVSELELLEP